MVLPTVDTAVTYPGGDVTSTGTVLHVEQLPDGRSAVLLDTTAFHPVDTAWPDQPADRGELVSDSGRHPVVDVVTGGIQDGRLILGRDLPVRTGTAGWVFVVAHILDGATPEVGDVVQTAVDADHRAALSAGHTACHLASLALDAALSSAWSKTVRLDTLGHPAFDALAIQESRIRPHGSVDTYRIGKSLRRSGFLVAALDDPGAVAHRADALLASWVASGAAIRIDSDGASLTSRRTWVCALPEGVASIPCGGTHLHDVAQLASITVALTTRDVEGGRELTMETTATPA